MRGSGRPEQGIHRGLYRRGLTGKREHGPVVRRVGLDVEEADAGTADRVGTRVEHLGSPALTDVRNTLDDRHGVSSTIVALHPLLYFDRWPDILRTVTQNGRRQTPFERSFQPPRGRR
jgi:hypothetical protein